MDRDDHRIVNEWVSDEEKESWFTPPTKPEQHYELQPPRGFTGRWMGNDYIHGTRSCPGLKFTEIGKKIDPRKPAI